MPGSRRALKRARATAGTTLPAAPGVSSCVSASVLRTSAAVSPDASAASTRGSTVRSGLRTHEASCPVNPEPYILDLRARLGTSTGASPDASAASRRASTPRSGLRLLFGT